MNKLNILHLTDLHLDDILSTNENLRKAKYKEFINGLFEKIATTLNEPIDFIICTGDFVNKGKILNFGHATTIINYLVSKSSLTDNEVVLCIGNHDFVIADDKSGKEKEARKDYYELEKKFQPTSIIKESVFHKIYYCDKKDIYFLTFDSTFGSKGENVPSKLSDIQIDEIITDIDEKIPSDKLLLILSHYPMILFNRSQAFVEVENWVDDHLWKSGNIIVERTYQIRKNSLTLWFFGDGHIPDFWSYNNDHHFLMTGMIGGNYTNPTYKQTDGSVNAYNKTNEVKVLQIDKGIKKIKINTFSYKSKAYRLSPHVGYWENTNSDFRLVDNPFENDKVIVPEGDKITSSEVKTQDNITHLISTSVEEEIIRQIREKKLYSFNRYSTSKNDVSLGWVSINKLFESNELLSRCIEKSVDWLDKVSGITISKNNSIFIGIDFWGAIFSSQASIIKDVDNYCIATKSKSEHNVLLEKPEFLCKKLELKNTDLINIILFTDVVSTGNTLLSIQEKIKECLKDKTNIKWIALSIISDTKQKRKVELNNFTALGSLCINLRIPILSNEELPDETILPVKYDIR